jgi:hypothetical protein
MNPIVCIHHPRHLELRRDGEIIGTVRPSLSPDVDDPIISMCCDEPLSFNDVEIIMDNWNQLEEQEQQQAINAMADEEVDSLQRNFPPDQGEAHMKRFSISDLVYGLVITGLVITGLCMPLASDLGICRIPPALLFYDYAILSFLIIISALIKG